MSSNQECPLPLAASATVGWGRLSYDILYSRNDVVSGATLSVVNGGGGIIGESTARLFLILFNEFTGPELDHGSLYLVRRAFAPAGVQVNLPVIGDVVLRKGNNGEVTGAITVLGDVTLRAFGTTTTISKLNGGSVTVKNGTVTGSLVLGGGHTVSASAGGITLTTASGVTITGGPGGITMTIPGGVTATVFTSGAVSLNLPLGVATVLKNAATAATRGSGRSTFEDPDARVIVAYPVNCVSPVRFPASRTPNALTPSDRPSGSGRPRERRRAAPRATGQP